MGLRRRMALVAVTVAATPLVLGGCTTERKAAVRPAEQVVPSPELTLTPADLSRNVPLSAEVGAARHGREDHRRAPRRRHGHAGHCGATRGRLGLGAERSVAAAAHLHRGGDRHRRLRGDHHPHHHLHHHGGVDEAAGEQHPVLRRQSDVRHGDAGDHRRSTRPSPRRPARTCSVGCSSRRTRRSQVPGPGWTTAARSTTGLPTSGGRARQSVSGPAWRVCRSARTRSATPSATATSRIGRQVALEVDNATKQMRVLRDGKLVRRIPVSLGKREHPDVQRQDGDHGEAPVHHVRHAR